MTCEEQLRKYAAQYETADFIEGDPSWFMHQVSGDRNREAMAFLAQSISYGSRKQFMPIIGRMLEWSGGETDDWVRTGEFRRNVPDEQYCFYRLYTCRQMRHFLASYQALMTEYGSLGEYVRKEGRDGLSAVAAICRWFSHDEVCGVVPRDTSSACKRLCMFLRWMVRTDSPVDLGLWADFIDHRTLIMPLDTHVLQQSVRLGLLKGRTASMGTARKLTEKLSEIFPDDPLKGDFALFGYGVNTAERR